MGILEDLLASAMGGGQGAGAEDTDNAGMRERAQAGGGGAMGRVLMALLPVILSMLASRGGVSQGGTGGGGLGDILGQILGGGGAQRGGGGGLGDILGQVLGGAGGGGGGGMGGGLGGLLEQMARAGYGEQARSWVGTGQNMPISPDVIGQIFGQGGIAEIARQAGVSEREASEGLSQLLPEVVDRVTPNGQVPDLDQLAASVEDLRKRLGA
jgi:uncharacterized protein YidB (DUF937 family)